MIRRFPPSGKNCTHARLIQGTNWMIPFIAIGAPSIGWKTLHAAELLTYMQGVLFLLYGLQILRLWCDRNVLTIRYSVQRGLAAEAARIYFVHMRARYLSSGIKVLAYTIVLNFLVVTMEPPNATAVLWLLMAPIACFSLVSLRMIVCHRSVKHGSFGADDLGLHELVEFLLDQCASDTPSGGGRERGFSIGRSHDIGIRTPDTAGVCGVRTA
jgi:hypothetical protein